MTQNITTVSSIIEEFLDNTKDLENISINDIRNSFKDMGFHLMMLVISVPLCLPLPVPPGLTTIAAIPLLLFCAQMLLGMRTPYLPKYILNKEFKKNIMHSIFHKSLFYLKKIEKVVHVRLWVFSSKLGNMITNIFCTLFAISIALPIPLTNFIPAIGIALISLGILNKDGIIVFLGIIIGCIGLCISLLVIALGTKAIKILLI